MSTLGHKCRYFGRKCRYFWAGKNTCILILKISIFSLQVSTLLQRCRHLRQNIDPFWLQNHRYLLEFESIDIWHKGVDTFTQKCRHFHLNIDLFGRHKAIVRRKAVGCEACINTHRGQTGLKTSHLFLSVSLSKKIRSSLTLSLWFAQDSNPQHSSFCLSSISHHFHCHLVLHWTWNSKVKGKDENLGF